MTNPLPSRSYVVPALVLLGVVLAVLSLTILQYRRQGAVDALPGEARAQLLEHGLTELRSVCLEGYAVKGPLHAHCVEQARFVILLPECGPDCQATASAMLPRAHR